MTAKTTKSKRIIATLVAASLVLPNLPLAQIGALTANAVEAAQAALASDAQASEGLEFTSNGDGTCSVVGIGDFTGTNLVIPSTSPEGDSVTTIGGWAFYRCTRLASVTIPDSVTTIGDWAFHYCTSLASITIPTSVTEIGSEAFSWCTSLESITIPDSVTEIGEYAFEDCTSLESITIPDSVTEISEYAFSNCTSLKSITLGNSVTSIGKDAFADCTSLESITIPDSVTEIGWNAFSDCTSLESITLGDSVTTIDSYAFSGCTSLESITMPDSVTSISDWAFRYCTSLESITIPDSVTEIGLGAFYGTAYYKDERNWEKDALYISNHLIEVKDTISGSYEIKEGTKTIAGYAFSYCTSLESITIPDSMTSIGDEAFYYCTSLETIAIPDSVTSIGNNAFDGTAYYNDEKDALYISNHLIGVKDTISGSYEINEGTKTIAGGAFYSCTRLESITIPDSVTAIGDWAFEDCTSLEIITIPDSVTSIGDGAFFECTSLASITIPDSVTSIGDWAFNYCTSLESITVSKDNPVYHSAGNCLIETESKTLIRGCKNSIIPDDGSVTAISGHAFCGCESLVSITIPDSVTSIDEAAFYGCTSLASITILNPKCRNINYSDIPTTATIYGYEGSTAQAYAEKNGNPFAVIDAVDTDDVTVSDTKVTVDVSDAVDAEAIILPSDITSTLAGKETTITTPVGTITFDATASDKIAEAGDDVLLMVTDVTTEEETADGVRSYSIILTVGGEAILPADESASNGNITVSLPYEKGLALRNIAVTYIGEDGATEDIPVVAYDPETGVVTFTTTHFSRYEITSNSSALPGDVDGSGEFDLVDIILMQQYMSGWDVEIDLEAGDVDNDGETGLIDIILMQQYMSGWDVELI